VDITDEEKDEDDYALPFPINTLTKATTAENVEKREPNKT